MASLAQWDATLADLADPVIAADVLSAGEPAGSLLPGHGGSLGRISTPLAARSASTRLASERARRMASELAQRGFVLHGRVARADLSAIAHLVVTQSGVWVVQCEHVHCARVSVRRRHLTGEQTLRIGSRDRTTLIDQLDQQVMAVRASLFDALDVPVQAALVLPGGDFPLLRSLSVRGHLVGRPSQLFGQLDGRGPLRRSRARIVAELLDARLG